MAEAIWYYAVDDQEKGPITSAQLKALAEAGKLKPDDLVWREGLDDWKPAREVSGLFTAGHKATARATDPTPPPSSAPSPAAAPAAPSPSPAASPAASPAETSEAVPKLEPVVADTSAASPVVGHLPDTTAPVVSRHVQAGAVTRAAIPPWLTSLLQPLGFGRLVGQPLLLVGLVLVLLAKGCDSVASRYVQQIDARLQLEQNDFQDEYDAERKKIQRQIDAIREDGGAADQGQLVTLNEQMNSLDGRVDDEREKLEEGAWQELKKKSRDASAGAKVWGYYREAVFVFGTILLTIGLLAVGFTGDGAQKWICLIMLAIITLSLYVGGAAWVGALMNLVR